MLTPEDLQQLDAAFSKRIKEELKPIRQDITHIRKDIKTVINYFDREYLDLRNRVERIELHLNLPTSS